MNDISPRVRWAHLLTLTALVCLEYLQSVMASFSSSYIMGGVEAAPEEFSLASAAYAAVAVVMLFKHRVLVQRWGYRRFIRLSLLTFALGALLTGLSDSVPTYILGRMIQAVGGSAFFTAGRVQVNHYQGPERLMAIKRFAIGIFLGAGLAPFLASELLEAWGWRAVFLVMLPLTALVAWLVEYAMPDHEPAEHDHPGQVHAGGTLALVAGIFALQFALERVPFDMFGTATAIWALALLALVALGAFVWHDWSRHDGLIPYRHFVDGRFVVGMAIYFFCYLVGAVSSYITPVFMVQGLGFAVTSSGWLLSATSLFGLVTMFIYFKCVPHHAKLKHYLWLALGVLFLHGWWMSSMDSDVTQRDLFWPLVLNSGVFVALAQGTAALGTFRHVDEKVFSQAYQVKNAMREVANASGVSLATVILQMRGSLHYARLAESTTSLNPLYGDGTVTLSTLGQPAPTEMLMRLSALITQQATLMACLDFYWALCGVALLAAAALAWQKKFV
jgi:DHA2 family multidrug resistance protein